MSDEGLRRDVAEMSDVELRREIAGIPTFGLLLWGDRGEERQRLLPLLEKEAQRRGIRTDGVKDCDDCNQVAGPRARNVYTFEIEDEQIIDASHKYFPKSSSTRLMKSYGPLGVQTRRPRKPIAVEKMYSSKKSPTALYGHTLRVCAVDQKEHDNEKSHHNENNCYRAHRCNLDPAMEKRSSAMGSGEPKGCSSGSLPKKARTAKETTSKCNPEHKEEKQQEHEEEICNVFTHEMDTLECDICCLPFESQIYSCKNGHAVCARCCINMERKCPSCNESIGDFRCRAMEKIIAGMTRPCRFKQHGCRETLRYTEARSHEEELCLYAPYRCPFDGCVYRGRLLYGHILDAHALGATSGLSGPMTMTLKKCEPFRALLLRDGEGVFLLLNGGGVLTGRSLAVVRVCPYPVEGPEGVEATYTIGVKGDEPGLSYLTASGKVQFVRRLEGYKAKGFLFVPDDFWGSSGSVTVTVYL